MNIKILPGHAEPDDPLAQRARVLIDALDVSICQIIAELARRNVRHGEVAVFLADDQSRPILTINMGCCK